MEINPSTHPKPDSDLDALTIELKMMLRLINKEEIRRAKDLEKKANKAKISPAQKKAATKARQAAISALDKAALTPVKMPCSKCKVLIAIRPGHDLETAMCKRCANRNRGFSLGIKPNTKPAFTSTHIVSGGAPGLGKRR